ncbi:TIGR02594 family protein, partial [Sphingobium sp.]|uniref:TIGR02594 family protein n=1 Tax=Sphingobium sp. TaxID=1912891 RepID=UPI003BB735E1
MNTKDPAWLLAARALLGTREAAGIANNASILGWAKTLGAKVLGMVYNADSVPWCGLFVAHALRDGGVDLSDMKVAVRAKAWATWGAALAADRLAPGAILVFDREGGGHVAFYVGEDASHYHVLGGNQGDCV